MNDDDLKVLSPYIKYFELIDSDLCISDCDGNIIYVDAGYCKRHGLNEDEFIGCSVFNLEKNNIFVPSITEMCLKQKKRVTLVQTNPKGDAILSTATPIFNDEGDIQYVLSYNALDIADVYYGNYKFDAASRILHKYLKLKYNDVANNETLHTNSPSMMSIIELIQMTADTPANILITGETGVGKSMIAKYIHQCSNRRDMPFVNINCGEIPSTLIESELFGYESGAFTGASQKGKKGKIEVANKGTLFLDEISELNYELQSKLLNVIQEKKLTRVGGITPRSVDFRLITATNKDLSAAIKEGSFREDLFYRLNVIPINIPPLRERREDIDSLINHFLSEYNKIYSKDVELTDDTITILKNRNWPGNVRELENFIERIVVLAKTSIVTPSTLLVTDYTAPPIEDNEPRLKQLMDAYEGYIFKSTYEQYPNSIQVAKHLGISQASASRKLRKYVPAYSGSEEE